ncbi:MAG: putative nucleotidyltransferase substrate binding domain-containing protein [Gammaproteobacteria bacterium]
MEIELIEIRDFLAARAPFDALAPETLDELPKSVSIRYLRRETPFPPPDADGDYLYIVRSGAIELVDDKGQLCEKLGEGDLYTTPCQLVDLAGGCHGHTIEDTLLYLLPCAALGELRKGSESFDRHFSDSLRERLRHAVTQVKEAGASDVAVMTVEVGDLIKKAPVTIAADKTIQQAAQVMAEQDVSSVLITDDGRLTGLVTDRDLRKRCVAVGLSVDQPVSAIMTSNLETIQRNALMIQALMTMTRLHVHHLPVMDGEDLAGMLTATDLARHHSTNSAFIATDIRKAKAVEDLAVASARLPELQLQLANSSATALHIGEAVACITDSITKRLIEMAEAELGPAPVPYAWMAGGSQARREQTSHSDQDNALIISDDMKPGDDEYFAALAKFVTDGLNACGFVYCPGDAMASNPKWRQPVRVWRKYYNEWIDKPDPMALMLSSIFFDLRVVHGDRSLYSALNREVLEKGKGNRIFIAYMAANALTHRPPLGFFRQIVLIHDGEHNDTFDIKHRGIVPITDLARVYALSQGLEPVNTTYRLRAAGESGAMSSEMAESLEDALEFIATLRIRHQAEQIRREEQADNFMPPAALSKLEREHLKDAFRVIQSMQDTLESRYQAARLR